MSSTVTVDQAILSNNPTFTRDFDIFQLPTATPVAVDLFAAIAAAWTAAGKSPDPFPFDAFVGFDLRSSAIVYLRTATIGAATTLAGIVVGADVTHYQAVHTLPTTTILYEATALVYVGLYFKNQLLPTGSDIP